MKEKLNDWCFSYNPKILAKDRDVEELKAELQQKIDHYKFKLEENEKKIRKNQVLYENKIKKIQDVLDNLAKVKK